MLSVRPNLALLEFRRHTLRVCVLTAALFVTACASNKAQTHIVPQYKIGSASARVAGYQHAVAPSTSDADGKIVVGRTPRVRQHNGEPIDPREPFSADYGARTVMSDSDDAVADVDVGHDTFDPFLDGPQWDRYKTKRQDDKFSQSDDDPMQISEARVVRRGWVRR